MPPRPTIGRTKLNREELAKLGEREHVPDPRAGQPLDPDNMRAQLRFPLAGSRSGDPYTLQGYQRCITHFGAVTQAGAARRRRSHPDIARAPMPG